MTGKQLKEFAALVPDNAVIEIDRFGWVPVSPAQIRAHLSIQPEEPAQPTAPAEDATLRNLQTVNG